MKKIIYIITFLLILGLIVWITVQLFLRSKQFGKLPSGARLEKIRLSKNYNLEKEEFEYPEPTAILMDEDKEKNINIWQSFMRLYEFITGKGEPDDVVPKKELPSIKTDLKNLDINKNLMVWLGHSSLYIQLDGKRILVDPVLERAFPIPVTMRPFKGTNIYNADDIPEIDILILTHDHWDHLNYPTLIKIKDRVKNIITPLGVGAHLEYWDIDMNKVFENDWWESIEIDNFKIHNLPARHFSGRGFIRNKSLWSSFLIETENYKLFLNGDSGYGPHFKEIGDKFGKIDFVAMEAGQYNEEWKYIHILPEFIPEALKDLNTKNFLPIHNSKFKLSKHNWYEPLEKLDISIKNTDVSMQTPMIGEILYLDEENKFSKWWEDFK